ncbi:NTP transferase domain-containing protein [Rhizobium sp. SAFR-030]|uniref:NTP transferase domain-containing protein n=1 Tax=Rhizobium sp. SAFR-030 TaxID=3387277 RepID=UPI003F7F7EF4
MIFGTVPLAEAEGTILAHAVQTADGRISKGTRLARSDVDRLAAEGLTEIVAACLEPGDLTEDVAAARLASALAAAGLELSEAATGRVNIHATAAGLFRADRETIDRFNRIDPAITLACLADRSSVSAGAMVATIKIIPLAVASQPVEAARAILAAGEAIGLQFYRPHSVALIQTVLPLTKPSVLDKTADLLGRRLAPSGSVVVSERRVAHEAGAVAEAIRAAAEIDNGSGPKMIVLFGASAVCDAEDVLPQAMRLAGGSVEHVGLPVDPGNLLVLGGLNDMPLVAAPGCARSPKENGFDWVLNRLLAGEAPTVEDLTGLGVGGLLMEIPNRPQPRELGMRRDGPLLIGGVLLAAGRASRMGEAGHKLLAEFDGMPLVRRVAERAIAALGGPLVAVTGYRAPEVSAALQGLSLTIAENRDYASGMASSLKTGLGSPALAAVAGVMVLLADMPGLSQADIGALADAFRKADGRAIVRAVAGGKRGNPVILPRATFGDLMQLEGDVGARHVIETCGLPIIDVEIGQAAHVDVDTPQAVEAAGGILKG